MFTFGKASYTRLQDKTIHNLTHSTLRYYIISTHYNTPLQKLHNNTQYFKTKYEITQKYMTLHNSKQHNTTIHTFNNTYDIPQQYEYSFQYCT